MAMLSMPPPGVDAGPHPDAGSVPCGVVEMHPTLAAALPLPVASGLLSGTAHYLHWGPIQISLTNFLIIVAMLVLFALALVVPFPQGRVEQVRGVQEEQERPDGQR
jgi:hypothetical protein